MSPTDESPVALRRDLVADLLAALLQPEALDTVERDRLVAELRLAARHPRDPYDVAREVTDEVLGPGTWKDPRPPHLRGTPEQ